MADYPLSGLTPRRTDILLPEEQLRLLHLARSAIDAFVQRYPPPSLVEADFSVHLREKRGAFVTLRSQGDLRGCVGYPVHRAPLFRTVYENAINAASRDPRFEPVETDELARLTIEISVLSHGDTPERPFIRIHGPQDITIGRDGLFMECHGRSGLLLPQVPIEQGWGVSQFLDGICRKTGVPCDTWRHADTALYRFSAEVFSESHALPA